MAWNCLCSSATATAVFVPPISAVAITGNHFQTALRKQRAYSPLLSIGNPRIAVASPNFKARSKATESELETDRSSDEINCIGTGLEVECVVPGRDELSRKNEEVGAAAAPDKFELAGSLLEWSLLISPFFFWGTAMVAMKEVLPKAGLFFVAAFRLIPAGLLLVGFAAVRGRKFPSGLNAWLSISVFALVDGCCFQGFLAEGLERTTAGLGSVIIDSQPLTVAVLASLFFGESIGYTGFAGLILGVIGLLLLEGSVCVRALWGINRIYRVFWAHTWVICLLLLECVLFGELIGYTGFARLILGVICLLLVEVPALAFDANNFSLWGSGEWWMLLAAQSMAIGTVIVRWVSKYSDPIMATGWHMVIGGLPLMAISIFNHDPALLSFDKLTTSDLLALLYTSIFGSAISYGVYFYNATRGSLTKLSSLTFLTPMFASFFGFIYLDETFTPVQLVGALITIAAIYLVNYENGEE